MSAPLTFPAGSMLTVLRDGDGSTDVHGDPIGGETEHEIGPCSVPKQNTPVDDDARNPRAAVSAKVRCPAGDDVRRGDRIRFPDGQIGKVVSLPATARNPFTGWVPHQTFTVKEVQ
ncbi:hypothetical protein ACWEQ4_01245 [Rhodococcus sp. NPDC003994]